MNPVGCAICIGGCIPIPVGWGMNPPPMNPVGCGTCIGRGMPCGMPVIMGIMGCCCGIPVIMGIMGCCCCCMAWVYCCWRRAWVRSLRLWPGGAT